MIPTEVLATNLAYVSSVGSLSLKKEKKKRRKNLRDAFSPLFDHLLFIRNSLSGRVDVKKTKEKSCGMPNYTDKSLATSLKFWIQIIIIMYRGDQDRGTKFVKPTGGHVTVWGCISARGLAISSEFMELRTEKWILIHHTIPSGKHQIGNIFFFHHNNVSKHAASAVQTYLDRKTYNWTLWGVDCPPQSPDLNITEAVVQILIFKTCSNPVLALYTVFLCMFTCVLLYCCTFVYSKIFRNEGWLNICVHFLTIWVHDSIWKQ